MTDLELAALIAEGSGLTAAEILALPDKELLRVVKRSGNARKKKRR
jgi:hypothetical protein